ncbi:MAG: hypothetical protein AAF959_18310 [Cyanobacteria bacterium P01_D01_bin.56]
MKQFEPVGIMTLVLWGSLQPVGMGQGCYIQDANGQVYDLGILCPDRGEPEVQPVLQTGDIQVTLRWDTPDDLDLIVVDPDSNVIDFGSPTSPTGGQLDVDANGFCERHSASPVENIFWPTGAAPDGDYLAYVTLAIPCSLQELANRDEAAATEAYAALAVPYTLTILNKGVTSTYDGISRPEQFGQDYSFQVGSAENSAENITPVNPDGKLQDELELPTFGLPEF